MEDVIEPQEYNNNYIGAYVAIIALYFVAVALGVLYHAEHSVRVRVPPLVKAMPVPDAASRGAYFFAYDARDFQYKRLVFDVDIPRAADKYVYKDADNPRSPLLPTLSTRTDADGSVIEGNIFIGSNERWVQKNTIEFKYNYVPFSESEHCWDTFGQGVEQMVEEWNDHYEPKIDHSWTLKYDRQCHPVATSPDGVWRVSLWFKQVSKEK